MSEPVLTALQYYGAGAGLVAAFIVSLNIGTRPTGWAFVIFVTSSIALIAWGFLKPDAGGIGWQNVVVNGIGPGAFPSAMNRAARDNAELVEKGIPSHRVGVTEDMAAGAIYLLSRAGDYVVGTTIPIDGGVVNANIGAGNFVDPSGG